MKTDVSKNTFRLSLFSLSISFTLSCLSLFFYIFHTFLSLYLCLSLFIFLSYFYVSLSLSTFSYFYVSHCKCVYFTLLRLSLFIFISHFYASIFIFIYVYVMFLFLTRIQAVKKDAFDKEHQLEISVYFTNVCFYLSARVEGYSQKMCSQYWINADHLF